MFIITSAKLPQTPCHAFSMYIFDSCFQCLLWLHFLLFLWWENFLFHISFSVFGGRFLVLSSGVYFLCPSPALYKFNRFLLKFFLVPSFPLFIFWNNLLSNLIIILWVDIWCITVTSDGVLGCVFQILGLLFKTLEYKLTHIANAVWTFYLKWGDSADQKELHLVNEWHKWRSSMALNFLDFLKIGFRGRRSLLER